MSAAARLASLVLLEAVVHVLHLRLSRGLLAGTPICAIPVPLLTARVRLALLRALHRVGVLLPAVPLA